MSTSTPNPAMAGANSTASPNIHLLQKTNPDLVLSMMPALLGGYPNKSVDLPVSAVFITIFSLLAIANAGLFIFNKRRGIFFPINMVTFGFCMARITTFALRVAWSKDVFNKTLGMVAQIMISAGVVLLYIINLILAKRLLDSRHPKVGRHSVVRGLFYLYYASLLVLLGLVIKAVVYRFGGKVMTQTDKNVMKVGPIWFSVFAFVPIPLSIIIALIPSTHESTPLGTRSDRSGKWEKVAVIVGAAFFLCLGSSLRAGINFLPARLNSNPAWYHSRAVFYVFLPTVEIIAVLFFLIGRMDRKFFVGRQGPEEKESEEKSLEEGVEKSMGASSSTSDSP